MAVTEQTSPNAKWDDYYLTKSGKKVGKDSLEINDNTPECESEGFIVFRDRKTDKAGMFNRDGKIVIPAEYNYLWSPSNGIALGRKGAKKFISDPEDEHPEWQGGKEVLIDTNNKVLIDSFNYDYENNIDFYSLIISTTPQKDTIRKNFKSIDGNYYSFIVFEKEFRTWLKTVLLDNFTKANLNLAIFNNVTIWQDAKGYWQEPMEIFVNQNFESVKSMLLELNSPKCEYNISFERLPFIYKEKEFEKYYNDCGQFEVWKYPVLSIAINHWVNKNLTQDHFDFLRTENGYKLISISSSKDEIK